jgi:glycosyltransferase 2 family protein
VWKPLAAILATIIAVWLLYHTHPLRSFDWRLATFSFTHVRLLWLIFAVAFIYATYWGRALRWAVFLKPLKPKPSMRNLLSATLVGFTAIILLGRPGEFVRPYLIAVKEEVSLPSQLAAWLLERLADLFMVLLLFGFALLHVGSSGVTTGPNIAWILNTGGKLAALSGAALVVVLVLFRHFGESARLSILHLLRFLPTSLLARTDKLLVAFFRGVESTQSEGALFLILAYSVLEWLLIVASYACLAESFPALHFTIVDIFVFMGFISLGASIQVPGVGGGVQVMAVLVLKELYHVRLETATAFAFLIWILTFVAVVPPGLVISLKEGWEWRKLRRISSEGKA